ncbi:endo-1,4-beta-xylanase 5-like [Amaranthus tricolor]|uniref:endo-1,4-beta-xylanase 5-like n=1 Tax=Amaranthus tricolor TaxID=29722 RepID=UPI00258607F2|nr:endo-1,4-beta-xylanase 5-like [Amaranthus tricolor]
MTMLMFWFLLGTTIVPSYGGLLYDHTAYSECKDEPEKALYNGGILKAHVLQNVTGKPFTGSKFLAHYPAFILHNLPSASIYSFSIWVKIKGADSALITASLKSGKESYNCTGNVIAKSGCWSFLKGGFTLQSPSRLSVLYFQNIDGQQVDIQVASASLQSFTSDEWKGIQQSKINSVRKRAVIIHVSDKFGNRLQGASITLQQVSKDFPFGSAISQNILANFAYQKWFVERFNAVVFENELKWYATEPKQGQVNYTIPDKMLEFVRAHKLIARGHNIFWEDPSYNPSWVQNLTGPNLEKAVKTRIQSLLIKYKGEFIHWDVSNEMLHYRFYEDRMGLNASLDFFKTAHRADPLATLFMNEFNVVETCDDVNSTADSYIAKLRDLQEGGIEMDGIGLEGHFTVPNPALIRATLDRLATLGLPIWLTEVDIKDTLDKHTQATYLEIVLREVFSHPSVKGIILWTALNPNGCYRMCLTDNNLRNLPAGDVVDSLLKEWQTGIAQGYTDEYGSYTFSGFLGDYNLHVVHRNQAANSTFSLSQSDETKHIYIQL